MNDTELYSRLVDLGMPKAQAWPLTARIRDTLHPVAAVAAAKIHQAMRTPVSPAVHGLGLTETAGSKAITVGVVSAGSGVAAGAIAGSVVPGIGTAIGAIAGLLAGKLIGTSQAPQRAALSTQIVNALNQIPSSFVGRTIPWSAGPPNLGLFQMIQAVMTLQIWFGWDFSCLNSPTCNGNWATTWTNMVKTLAQAIVANPVGASVTLTIDNEPGGQNHTPSPYTFVNPGLAVGPDQLAATVMKGAVSNAMIQTGRPDMAQNMITVGWPTAQKVFALMFDHAAADLVPNSLSTTLANSPIVNVPPAIAAAAAPIAAATVTQGQIPALTTAANPTGTSGAGAPPVATVSTPTTVNTQYTNDGPNAQTQVIPPQNISVPLPVTSALTPGQDTTAGLLQNMLASNGLNFQSPPATQLLADVAAGGVEATPQGPPITGSIPMWAILGAGGLLLLLLLKK